MFYWWECTKYLIVLSSTIPIDLSLNAHNNFYLLSQPITSTSHLISLTSSLKSYFQSLIPSLWVVTTWDVNLFIEVIPDSEIYHTPVNSFSIN